MDNIVFGQYVPGNSYVYRIDPRVKIISLVLLVVMAFLIPNLTGMAIFLGIVILFIISTGIPFMRILKGLKPMIFLLVFTFFIQIAYTRTGSIVTIGEVPLDFSMNLGLYNLLIIIAAFILWVFLCKISRLRFLMFIILLIGVFISQHYLIEQINFISYDLSFYTDGVERATFVILRIAVVIFMSSILTFTTSPNELNNGIESLLKPLKLIGVNPGVIGMMISITLRFIPTLLIETKKIMNAQASRGADFNDSRFHEKVTQIISLLVPMFVISFKRADELANAMESRGYVIGESRTKLDEMRFHLIDYITLFISIGVLGLVIGSYFI